MQRDDILKTLESTLTKVMDAPPPDITLQTELRDGLGLDSFAALELMFELEDACGVTIPQESAAGFRTVEDVVVFIENRGTC